MNITEISDHIFLMGMAMLKVQFLLKVNNNDF
jgi:hypothetical protein